MRSQRRLQSSERGQREKRMLEKIVGREELTKRLEGLKAQGKRIVFTNGVFDLVHAGHVRYLREAAALGDLLVVGLNSDSSVSREDFKGPKRPIVPQGDRAEVLAALEMVGYVTIFDERTAEAVVAELEPDIYVKGGDYRPEDLPEARVVWGYGGEVKVLSYHEDRSTTGIIQKIVETYCPKGEG